MDFHKSRMEGESRLRIDTIFLLSLTLGFKEKKKMFR